MKAIRLHQFGGAEALQVDEVSKPVCGENQVLVKVHVASVNPLDMKIASGMMQQHFPIELPWIPGIDFAGTIEEVGANVREFKKGDTVYGSPGVLACGAYAEYVLAMPGMIALKPSSLSFAEAASAVMGLTAWNALLSAGELKAGKVVLIHAGAGCVGAYAIQLAHRAKAYVITTCSAKNRDFVLSLGADEVIDYETEKFEEIVKNVDFVLDAIGGPTQEKSLGVLKKGGTLISIIHPVSQELCQQLGVQGSFLNSIPSTEGYNNLTKLFEAGELKTDISKIFPYTQPTESWKYMIDKNRVHGKVLFEFIPE
jgi:NADPH:quinone reductase-like Zn-dependent oxidoreductase